MIALSDRQLAIVMEAAKALPPEKRSVYLERVAAMLRLRRHGKRFADDDVADVAGLARWGLMQAVAQAAPAAAPMPRWDERSRLIRSGKS